MWGPTEDPNSAWKRNDPMVQIPRWSPTTPASGSTAATARPTSSAARTACQFLEGLTIRTNITFRDNYIAAGGNNAVFNFPANGTHSWEYWGAQLQAMKPDLISHLG